MGHQTPSRYGTPGPPQDMSYDHHSPYSHRGNEGGMYHHAGYDTSGGTLYGPLSGELGHQPYSTPDTSPPTPSRASDVLTTRSGLNIHKGTPNPKPLAARASRVEKSTPRKKKERAKSSKKVEGISKPLSELAIEQPNVHVADIEAYVNRSVETRMKEVEESKTPGRIKRPMNAFMLYRKAYQNLAKNLCTQNNHQVVSQVCGSGWPLEPEHVREQFNEWAKTERANHQKAHPGYKFTPSKPRPKARDGEGDSDEGDLDDLEWGASRASSRSRQLKKPGHGRNDAPASIFHGYPQLSGSPMGLGVQTQSMYHYSNPGKPIPAPYSQTNLSGQYYQQSVHQRQDGTGFVEDVLIRKTPSPAMGYAPPPMDGRFDALGQYGHMPHPDGLEPMIDPGLMGHGGHGYGDPYGDPMLEPRWTNPLEFGSGRQDLLDAIGLLLLAHACYSAQEHSALQSFRAASPLSTFAVPATTSLPVDITIETGVATVVIVLGLVLGAPNLRPIQWRVWAGKIEREGEAGFLNGSGEVEKDYMGNPFRILESRPGFVDIRKQKRDFANWAKGDEKTKPTMASA
ncbi:hmg box protein [Colletotrichum karsti]|uniref:Hmg box protein n=1 Tax=Colletotrichum karsti TaxID=1095194 RepID=A0A9P6HTD8_9PEZI|nr:hmg box protein [Colletotrichum karsti]KAF9869814.1 hmg box protein [Colletotrichum karsti]